MQGAVDRNAGDLGASVTAARAGDISINCTQTLKSTGNLVGKKATTLHVQRAAHNTAVAAKCLSALEDRMVSLKRSLPFRRETKDGKTQP